MSSIPPSFQQNIDALVGPYRWAGQLVTYSFPDAGSAWSTDNVTGYGPVASASEPWNSAFSPISNSDQQWFQRALAGWSNVAAIDFLSVADTLTSVGDIRIAFSSTSGEAWAYAPAPNAYAGDIWINADSSTAAAEWTPGSYSFTAVLHELGHALGLKHPFDGATTLPAQLDLLSYSVMSYSARPGEDTLPLSFYPTTPMVLDIAAIQHAYGARTTFESGDSTYAFTDAATYHQTIWDGGGVDCLRYSGTAAASIDLREGRGSTIGRPVHVTDPYGRPLEQVNNVWIAYGTRVENATGGTGNDHLQGNALANDLAGGAGNDTLVGGEGNDRFDWTAADRGGSDVFRGEAGDDIYMFDRASDVALENPGEGTDTICVSLSYSIASSPNVENLLGEGPLGLRLTGNAQANMLAGGAGSDTLDGASGTDVAIYPGPRSAYSVLPAAGAISVTPLAGSTATDRLISVERVQFSDTKLAFDLDGTAGMVAKLIGAVFGAAAVHDTSYVGIGVQLADAGMADETLAQLALDARLGPGASGEAIVDLLHLNILGEPPTADARSHFVTVMTHAFPSPAAFTLAAADSPMNASVIDLVGLQLDGLRF